MSFVKKHDMGVIIHARSIALAKACREIIQGCLREEEWADCDREFYAIIKDGLTDFHSITRQKLRDQEAESN